MGNKIGFNVSAKAARLIGRENISDPDGALIELVKNSYDADAECVYLKLVIPFPVVDENVVLNNYNVVSQKDRNIIDKFIIFPDLKIKETLTGDEIADLQKHLFKYNKIYIIDNGTGMDLQTLSNSWMSIGTSYKEKNIYSPKGRVRNGAKGIGRFALDKLSRQTTVYTKEKKGKLINWKLNWDLFDNVELLSEVTAELNYPPVSFEEVVKDIIGEDFINENDYCFETGTIIELSPLREEWPNKLFRRINTSINSLHPLFSPEVFDIFMENVYEDKYDYSNVNNVSKETKFDYNVHASYDKGNLVLKFNRNEIDMEITEVEIVRNKELSVVSLKEFWEKTAFKNKPYRKEDFSKEVIFEYDMKQILTDYSPLFLEELGIFELDLYFLKSTNSTIEIVKKINQTRRKDLINNFEGIKIYRDNFKVRPYGDKGPLFDWLSLGARQNKNPGAVTNRAPWRVMPYQVLGNVKISRIGTPSLVDNANRESLSSGEDFNALIDIVQFTIEKFEYDRQYPLMEYGDFKDSLKDSERKAFDILSSLQKKKEYKKVYNFKPIVDSEIAQIKDEYTQDEVEDALETMADRALSKDEIIKILMTLSSSGVMTNTFSHEIHRVATNLGLRNGHMKVIVDNLLDYEEYDGQRAFNPYKMIEQYESTDKILSSWVSVIINGLESELNKPALLNLNEFLYNITELWKPLLATKYVNVNLEIEDEEILYQVSEIDMYLMINNFMLNSLWFLEENKGRTREITIRCTIIKNKIYLFLENNGPRLAEKYKNNHNEIFLPGKTSKKKGEGTGLGLWIFSEACKSAFGEKSVISDIDGFGLLVTFGLESE